MTAVAAATDGGRLLPGRVHPPRDEMQYAYDDGPDGVSVSPRSVRTASAAGSARTSPAA